MKKLVLTLSAAILLSAFPTQSMEITVPTNAQNNSDCPLPDFKLEDELIFACCVIQQKKSPVESKKALKHTIKNFIHVRSSCKKYYEFLTYEQIGDSCKNHSAFAKNALLHERTYDAVINYYYRPLVLILIHADAKFKEQQDKLLEDAIYNSDAYMLKTLLKHGAELNEKKEHRDPLIFSAKTVKIAQILMNNGIDIHASRNTDYNFLSDLLRKNPQCSWTHKNHLFLSDGTEFSFEEGNVEFTRPTDQATWELIEFCLKHNVAMSNEDRELYNKFTSEQTITNNNLNTHDSVPQKEIIAVSEEKKTHELTPSFKTKHFEQ